MQGPNQLRYVPKHETQQPFLTYVIAINSYQILHAYPVRKSSIFGQNYKNPMKIYYC